MSDIHTDYYEKPELWGRNLEQLPAHTAERVRVTPTIIPDDVSTILDVGCGDGVITNELARRFDVTGLDISGEALKHVKTKTYQGTLETVEFAPKSFDAVTAFEVLEHLPVRDYELAIARMAVLSRRYVVITVPYREPPKTDFTRCPACGTTFNVFCHLRRFDERRLRGLIPGMQMAKLQLIGPRIKHWSPLLLHIRQNLLGVWKPSDVAICPQCGNDSFPYTYGLRHYLTAGMRRAAAILWPFDMAPKWAAAIYEQERPA